MEVDAFIGLGANLGKPENHIISAVTAYSQNASVTVHALSPLYQTRPMGSVNQNNYVNAVLWIRTTLSPQTLLAVAQQIEEQHHRHRVPGESWGPRTLDCDILLYGQVTINNETLTIPHPGLLKRDFVLRPLYDLCPTLHLPNGQAIEAALKNLSTRYIIQECPAHCGQQ